MSFRHKEQCKNKTFCLVFMPFDRVKQYHTIVLFFPKISANVTDFIQDFNKQVNIVSYILDSVLSVFALFHQ